MKYKIIKTQRVLSPTSMTLAPYAINPYRGCEFGCAYCYARKNKNAKGMMRLQAGIKTNAPEVLRKELAIRRPARVILGTTTECFQYAESRYHVTKEILTILNAQRIPCVILTKSPLIKNVIPLLSKDKRNKIYFTFNFARDSIVSLFEKKTAPIKERQETVDAIAAADIPLRVHAGPYIPHLSSLEELLSLLPKTVMEINVELYHSGMGNFRHVTEIIRRGYGDRFKEEIASVYSSSESYIRFADSLGKRIRRAIRKTGKKIYYIVPGYGRFYNSSIDYTDTL